MIDFKIASSRTLCENPASDWRKDWNMDTFLKALEEVYAVEPADRLMETGSVWQAIALDLCRDLEVDPADMSKLSKKYVAVLVEKKLLHPIREVEMHQTPKNLLYTFVARDNPAKDSRSNRTFHSEFKQALTDDPDYQRHATIEQFLLQVVAGPVPVRLPERQEGTTLSTTLSTPPIRQSSHGWPPTIAQASTRPCDSTFAPMEHQWCLSRERSRIDHPKETPGRTRKTHPPPADWVPLSTTRRPAKGAGHRALQRA